METKCECGEPLELEIERDVQLCAECQKSDMELTEENQRFIDRPQLVELFGHAHWVSGYAWGKLQCLADGTTEANRTECQRIFREFRSMYRYAFRDRTGAVQTEAA